jgi:uncharacterized protein (TIGR02145 family)
LVYSCCKDEDNIIKDNDGNVYTHVIIGTQTWLVENLKVTTFNDGTPIPYVPDGHDWWNGNSEPAYCWYDNDEATNKDTYGALYNWYAVNTGKLCLEGWHVPTDGEWLTLTDFLGGSGVAGGKLIEVGTSHWELTNPEISNETGFTALPGGFRYGYGDTPSNPVALFYGKGLLAYMWTSSVKDAYSAWWREMAASAIYVFRNSLSFQHGCSVRCIKD